MAGIIQKGSQSSSREERYVFASVTTTCCCVMLVVTEQVTFQLVSFWSQKACISSTKGSQLQKQDWSQMNLEINRIQNNKQDTKPFSGGFLRHKNICGLDKGVSYLLCFLMKKYIHQINFGVRRIPRVIRSHWKSP